jgi:hypothetical protein
MHFVENLKSIQLRDLIRMLKSSPMQNFNIFKAREGYLFQFANLSGVWNFGGIFFYWAGHTCQQPVSVLTTWDDHQVRAPPYS